MLVVVALFDSFHPLIADPILKQTNLEVENSGAGVISRRTLGPSIQTIHRIIQDVFKLHSEIIVPLF